MISSEDGFVRADATSSMFQFGGGVAHGPNAPPPPQVDNLADWQGGMAPAQALMPPGPPHVGGEGSTAARMAQLQQWCVSGPGVKENLDGNGKYQRKRCNGPQKNPRSAATPAAVESPAEKKAAVAEKPQGNRRGMIKPDPVSGYSYPRALNDHKRYCPKLEPCGGDCALRTHFHERWQNKANEKHLVQLEEGGKFVEVNGLWNHLSIGKDKKVRTSKKKQGAA